MQGKFKKAASAVLCALGLTLSLPAAAAPDAASYQPQSAAAQEMLKYYKDPYFLDAIGASAYFMPGLKGKRRAVYQERMKELFANGGAAEYLVRELESAGFFNADFAEDFETFALYVWPLMDNLMSRGMLRLNDEMLKAGFKASYEICGRVDARTCAAMIFGIKPAEQQKLINAVSVYLNECPQPEFDDYVGVVCASITAELNDYPPVRQLTPEEERLAEQVYFNLLKAYYQEDPVRGGKLIDVLDAPQNYSPAEQCAASRDVMRLVLKAQGRAGILVRLYLLSSG